MLILKCAVAIVSKNVHSLDKKYFIGKKKNANHPLSLSELEQ